MDQNGCCISGTYLAVVVTASLVVNTVLMTRVLLLLLLLFLRFMLLSLLVASTVSSNNNNYDNNNNHHHYHHTDLKITVSSYSPEQIYRFINISGLNFKPASFAFSSAFLCYFLFEVLCGMVLCLAKGAQAGMVY